MASLSCTLASETVECPLGVRMIGQASGGLPDTAFSKEMGRTSLNQPEVGGQGFKQRGMELLMYEH